jgi:hypothetical protein
MIQLLITPPRAAAKEVQADSLIVESSPPPYDQKDVDPDLVGIPPLPPFRVWTMGEVHDHCSEDGVQGIRKGRHTEAHAFLEVGLRVLAGEPSASRMLSAGNGLPETTAAYARSPRRVAPSNNCAARLYFPKKIVPVTIFSMKASRCPPVSARRRSAARPLVATGKTDTSRPVTAGCKTPNLQR